MGTGTAALCRTEPASRYADYHDSDPAALTGADADAEVGRYLALSGGKGEWGEPDGLATNGARASEREVSPDDVQVLTDMNAVQAEIERLLDASAAVTGQAPLSKGNRSTGNVPGTLPSPATPRPPTCAANDWTTSRTRPA